MTRLAVTLLVLLSACVRTSEGRQAWDAGRHQEALAAFVAAERAAGHDADAELLHDLALAALENGRAREAEYSIEKAVVRGGEDFEPLREFVFGNAAWLRCVRAESAARLKDAEPGAWETAIRACEAAAGWWQRAALRRADWPAARRNVQRALDKLDALRAAKEQAEREAQKVAEPEPEGAIDEPPPDDPGESEEQLTPIDASLAELSPAELSALFERLEAKQAEKLSLRRSRRAVHQTNVERDW